MSNEALVREVLVAKLHEVLSKQSVQLWNRWGLTTFNFGECASNVADVLLVFFRQNGRMPNLIFNDGVFGPFASMAKTPFDPLAPLPWTLAVNIHTKPNTTVMVQAGSDDSGNTWFEGVDFSNVSQHGIGSGYGGAGVSTIPLEQIAWGAFPTWGILLTAYSAPQFLIATDDGLLLTTEGVAMAIKSLPWWLGFRLERGGFVDTVENTMPGIPTWIGIPEAMIAQVADAARRDDKADKMFFVQGAIMAIGFAFGLSAVVGLLAGAFTIPNITGALNLVSRLTGTNLGQLTTALNLIGLTAGPDVLNNVIDSTTAPVVMDDYDFLTDIGIDPNSIDYSDLGGMGVDLSEFSNGNLVFDDTVWADIGINPDSIGYDLSGLTADPLADYWPEITNEQFNDAVGAMNSAPAYDDIAISSQNTAAVAARNGPVSSEQFSAAAKAAPQVAGAAKAAMGNSAGNAKATPAQAVKGAATARAQAQNAASAGDPGSAGIWSAASKMLETYAGYQLAAARAKTALPAKTTYPSAVGQAVRQPDGSISIRNADGTISTVRPSGATQQTPLGGTLPSFLNTKTMLLIGGGVIALGALAIAIRSK